MEKQRSVLYPPIARAFCICLSAIASSGDLKYTLPLQSNGLWRLTGIIRLILPSYDFSGFWANILTTSSRFLPTKFISGKRENPEQPVKNIIKKINDGRIQYFTFHLLFPYWWILSASPGFENKRYSIPDILLHQYNLFLREVQASNLFRWLLWERFAVLRWNPVCREHIALRVCLLRYWFRLCRFNWKRSFRAGFSGISPDWESEPQSQ